MSQTLAYFVSSHGFGHAARAAAVIDHLCRLRTELRIELFTGTPRWFFEQSLGGQVMSERIRYRSWSTDVGLVQETALAEDLRATVQRLESWLPLRSDAVHGAAEAVRSCHAEMVVADISPLGLRVAQELGLPSVLVENFTWDWIYRGYGEPALLPFADTLEPVFDGASLRLRTTPFCGEPRAESSEIRILPPVARSARLSRSQMRRTLEARDDAALVLVTMGGVPWKFEDLESHLRKHPTDGPEIQLVVAGGADTPTRLGNAFLIPHRSEFYHPDLVQAADAVIGKLGYSTVAEVARTGCRLGYVARPRFPESPELEGWVKRHLSCLRLDAEQLVDGTWLDVLPSLLQKPSSPQQQDGAEPAAHSILRLLDAESP